MKDNGSLRAGVSEDSLWNNCFTGDGVYQITVIFIYNSYIFNCTIR